MKARTRGRRAQLYATLRLRRRYFEAGNKIKMIAMTVIGIGLPAAAAFLVLRGRARITDGGAPELLQRLARVYLGPDVVFPPMPDPPPGFTIRVSVEKVSGIGDWS